VTGAPPPVPVDDKDWTWVLTRPCPDCGFDPTALRQDQVAAALRAEAATWPPVLARPDAGVRPRPGTWSPLEYGAHVRDVLRRGEERLRLMLDEDDPVFANWDQDATAVADRYDLQDPAAVAAEVVDAGEAVAVGYERLTPDQWSRPGRRSNGSAFTVESFGRYVAHDLVHHRWDVQG
jgi:hypothetical protein